MRHLPLLMIALIGCGISAADTPEGGGPPGKGAKPGHREGAGHRGREGRPGPPEGERRFGDFLRTADTNKDGVVSREEFFALERIARLPEEQRNGIFNRLDKNGDGLIQMEELRMPARPEGGRPPFPNLAELDLNRDGSVSFEEFEKSEFAGRLPEDRRRAFFDRLDRNGDGKLSPEDQPRRRGPGGPGENWGRSGGMNPSRIFRDFDEDGDGFLSFAEFRKLPWIRDLGEDEQEDHFEKLDGNKNLTLGVEEFKVPDGGDHRGPRGPRGPNGAQKGAGPAGE